jgi:KamA family protein
MSRLASTYGVHDLDRQWRLRQLPQEVRTQIRAVAEVFPFKVNAYVIDELIDWRAVPDDPIYRLTFGHPAMLDPASLSRLAALHDDGAPAEMTRRAAREIQLALNPHPEGQLTHNVPFWMGQPVPGVQHKYAETCLIFPAKGQTCHSYCTYCFRWAQFVGESSLKFATDQSLLHEDYVRAHPEVSDVLFTGGDPLVMNARVLASYLEPFLRDGFRHILNIRIGSKALSFWPYRFLTDPDADDLLRLFESVAAAGKHLALMAHFSHPRELSTPAVRHAIARVRATGAEIRTQAPVVAHVNDSAEVWTQMWKEQVRLGCIPYYMFVARDTGAHDYFAVPLASAFEIFSGAYRHLSGLCRTVRGPVMSTTAGKVVIDGVEEFWGHRVFVLRFIQARDPDWCLRPFLAHFDAEATWLSDLRPANRGSEPFFAFGPQDQQCAEVSHR